MYDNLLYDVCLLYKIKCHGGTGDRTQIGSVSTKYVPITPYLHRLYLNGLFIYKSVSRLSDSSIITFSFNE